MVLYTRYIRVQYLELRLGGVQKHGIMENASGDLGCVVCSSHADRVHLWCGHIICAPCGVKAHDFGHRHCPVCRVPHLLHVAQLRANAWQLRSGYNNWRRGKPGGSKGDSADVSGFKGWRLAKNFEADELPAEENYETYSESAGLLWMFSNERVLQAKVSQLQAELRVCALEKQLIKLKEELGRMRTMHPRQVHWADDYPGKCLAEAVGTPRRSGRYRKVPRLHERPHERRHIHGTERAPTKLSAQQVAARSRLIGQQVRVLEGPDTNLRGTLVSVSPHGYATIVLPGPGEERPLPPRVAADPRYRFAVHPRCIYSYAIEPAVRTGTRKSGSQITYTVGAVIQRGGWNPTVETYPSSHEG